MNLLLFVSALLTGLTGAITGAYRAEAPAVHQSIARAVEVAAENVPQQPMVAPQDVYAILRPIASIRGAMSGRALNFEAPALDIGRVYERLLV